MSTQKKLKRGLADLSNFFAQPLPTEQKSKIGRLAIESPEHSNSESSSKPSLITASVLSFSSLFQASNLIELTEAIKFSFAGIHFVTLTAGKNTFEYRIESEDINYEKISWSQLEPFIQPQMCVRFLQPESNPHKALAILDSTPHHSLFELLDHCIFVVEPDTKQLMQVYQVMKIALSKNLDLHCSLLLIGNGAERLSEFIYERFSEMISNFLGYDLGFLGWMENREICMNSDLLKEEANSAFVRYSKIHLNHLLDRPQQLVSS